MNKVKTKAFYRIKKSKDILSCILASWIVLMATCSHYSFFSIDNLKNPLQYQWDSLVVLSLAKVVGNHEVPLNAPPFIKNLGAPFGADWSSFPFGRDLIWSTFEVLMNFMGLCMAANVLLLIAHVSSAITTYISLRWVGSQVLWAFVFSICFGLAPFLFWRSWNHIMIAFVYAVPIFCAATYHLFNNGVDFLKNKKNLLILALISTVLGGGIYYQAVYFCLLFTAAIFLILNKKSLKSGAWVFFFAALLAGFFILQSWPVYFDSLKNGKNFEAVVRHYSDVQIGALKPLELFLPGPHSGLPILSQISQFYLNQDVFTRYGISAEMFAAYLGLPGILAFLSLLGFTGFQILKRNEQQISGWFWFVLGIFSFSVIGGLGGVAGLGKFYLLRGANRFSIFILAASFFFLAALLTKHQAKLGKPASYAIGLLFVLLALGEVALRPFAQKMKSPDAITLTNDTVFFGNLESQLAPGSMIFNLPPTRFPEGPLWYPELRGFLASDSLRFSYGSVAGRAREGWQEEVFQLPPPEMVVALERYGFSGILAYIGPDLNSERNEDLKDFTYKAVEGLQKLGLPVQKDPSGSFIFFKLKPADYPVFPKSPIYFANGFWHPEIQPGGFTPAQFSTGNFRWAAQSKTITEVFNEQTRTRTLVIKGKVLGTQDGNLQILVRGKPVFSGEISPSGITEVTTEPIEVEGHHSIRFDFQTDVKPIFKEGRKFNFALSDFEATWK